MIFSDDDEPLSHLLVVQVRGLLLQLLDRPSPPRRYSILIAFSLALTSMLSRLQAVRLGGLLLLLPRSNAEPRCYR
jgi:hypothetical protein